LSLALINEIGKPQRSIVSARANGVGSDGCNGSGERCWNGDARQAGRASI